MKSLLALLLFQLHVICSQGAPRDGKNFYFFTPRATTCSNSRGQSGFCLIQGCGLNQLKASGRCGIGNLGTCCIVEKSCDDESEVSPSFFVNPGYPSPTASLGGCKHRVKVQTDTCQVRVDFLDFELHQPDVKGDCVNDIFYAAGTSTQVPHLCGRNSGQHMYIDVVNQGSVGLGARFAPSADIELNVRITEISLFPRKWNLKITQIPCSSPELAPRGCLQFFRNTGGFVQSFNYGKDSEQQLGVKSIRQINNLKYDMCFHQQEGYCSMVYMGDDQANEHSFSLTGDDSQNTLDTSKQPRTDCAGVDDYIMISNAIDNNGHYVERVCGNKFPKFVRSEMGPFRLHYVTGPTELKNDIDNKGFKLRYRQERCHPSALLTGRFTPSTFEETKTDSVVPSSFFHTLTSNDGPYLSQQDLYEDTQDTIESLYFANSGL